MLHAELTQHTELGAELPFTEEEAKTHFEAAIKSGDPAKYAAQAGAAAACGAVAGPYVAALCSLGAGKLWDNLFGPNCEEQGGQLWCLEQCTHFRSMRTSGGVFHVYCDEMKPISAVRIDKSALCRGYTYPPNDCCTKKYCQLPSMPAPTLAPTRISYGPLVRVPIRDFPPPVARAVHRYPVGSIAAKEGAIWRVAVPLTTGLSGSFARTHGEVAPATTQPFLVTGPRVPLVPISELIDRTQQPWYKSWKTYAVIGGVAALGVGAYVVLRKRKRR